MPVPHRNRSRDAPHLGGLHATHTLKSGPLAPHGACATKERGGPLGPPLSLTAFGLYWARRFIAASEIVEPVSISARPMITVVELLS